MAGGGVGGRSAGLGRGVAGAADLVKARDGSGVYGYKDTPVLPWCGFHVHDPDRPAPRRVDPGPAPAPVPAPADAVVLFGGGDLSRWEATDWRVVEGVIEAGKTGVLTSREKFGDCQIHVEWMPPAGFQGPWYDQGNNGVLVHLDEPVRGETGHRIVPEYRVVASEGPLVFSGHGCPVRFRNVWVRRL